MTLLGALGLFPEKHSRNNDFIGHYVLSAVYVPDARTTQMREKWTFPADTVMGGRADTRW